MIDFTNCKQLKKAYGGANGNKLSVIYNGKIYMLKFPSQQTKNPNISYTNSCVSEYLGSHIFNLLGVKAQNTILGTFTYQGKTKNVVACEDFTNAKETLQFFSSIKNRVLNSESNGKGTELDDVINAIENQNVVDTITLKEFFWDMFVIDALIGNWDRHNENWGFLYNQTNDSMRIAPVYDLGSSLFPQIDENMISMVLKSKVEINKRVTDVPNSALLINRSKINYFTFITQHKNVDCDNAIKRITPRINLIEINKLIDEVEIISNNHKIFLKRILELRKNNILDKAYKDLS